MCSSAGRGAKAHAGATATAAAWLHRPLACCLSLHSHAPLPLQAPASTPATPTVTSGGAAATTPTPRAPTLTSPSGGWYGRFARARKGRVLGKLRRKVCVHAGCQYAALFSVSLGNPAQFLLLVCLSVCPRHFLPLHHCLAISSAPPTATRRAFEKLTDVKWGVAGIQFRPVPCDHIPAQRAPDGPTPMPSYEQPQVGAAEAQHVPAPIPCAAPAARPSMQHLPPASEAQRLRATNRAAAPKLPAPGPLTPGVPPPWCTPLPSVAQALGYGGTAFDPPGDYEDTLLVKRFDDAGAAQGECWLVPPGLLPRPCSLAHLCLLALPGGACALALPCPAQLWPACLPAWPLPSPSAPCPLRPSPPLSRPPTLCRRCAAHGPRHRRHRLPPSDHPRPNPRERQRLPRRRRPLCSRRRRHPGSGPGCFRQWLHRCRPLWQHLRKAKGAERWWGDAALARAGLLVGCCMCSPAPAR